MLDPLPFVVTAFIPCKNCGYLCVVTERFVEAPSQELLDRHVFQCSCENCSQLQARVGAEAFQRTIIEWKLKAVEPDLTLAP